MPHSLKPHCIFDVQNWFEIRVRQRGPSPTLYALSCGKLGSNLTIWRKINTKCPSIINILLFLDSNINIRSNRHRAPSIARILGPSFKMKFSLPKSHVFSGVAGLYALFLFSSQGYCTYRYVGTCIVLNQNMVKSE